jgi:hypothetical protein
MAPSADASTAARRGLAPGPGYSQPVRPFRRGAGRGRVLATRFGLNPNSSSLGVDVTFLLFGAAAVAFLTPVMGALLRLRRPAAGNHVEPAAAKDASA